jgi:hypothetical protein
MNDELLTRKHIEHMAHMINDLSASIQVNIDEENTDNYIEALKKSVQYFDDLQVYVNQLRDFLVKEVTSKNDKNK